MVLKTPGVVPLAPASGVLRGVVCTDVRKE
jgi:hypothetical protein